MPQPWIPPKGKLEKKLYFSPYCGDETTTYYITEPQKSRKRSSQFWREKRFSQKKFFQPAVVLPKLIYTALREVYAGKTARFASRGFVGRNAKKPHHCDVAFAFTGVTKGIKMTMYLFYFTYYYKNIFNNTSKNTQKIKSCKNFYWPSLEQNSLSDKERTSVQKFSRL